MGAGRREALSEAHLGLLLELSARLAEGGDTAAAIEALEQVVVVDALHEGAHRALMRLFAAARSPPAGARRSTTSCGTRFGATWRRSPTPRPHASIGRCCAARASRTRWSRSCVSRRRARRAGARRSRARHNLPIALTSFIGRDRELREVARLLDRNRLVTLTGAGGSGKTRLGLEAATARVERVSATASGSWSWRASSDPALVPAATASALGLTLPSQRPALEGLSAQLGQWHALLILDNCEHLIAACAVLAEHLLGACPGLRILATSREPLRVPGEVTWRVPSLALPVPDGR